MEEAYYVTSKDPWHPEEVVCSNCYHGLFIVNTASGYLNIGFYGKDRTGIPNVCPKCGRILRFKDNMIKINNM